MQTIAGEVREQMDRRRGEVAAALRAGASGAELCSVLTRSTDDAVRRLFEAQAARTPGGETFAVIALGGYGRAELCPWSDIDILLLREDGAPDPAASAFAAVFIRLLWDAGLEAGHSVRTVEEVLALRGSSPDAWAAMLEGRHVCGPHAPMDRLRSALTPSPGLPPDRWFLEHLLADTAARHRRYGNSVKLLEPNIKKSAGGLRDLHVLYWLARTADPGFPPPDGAGLPALFPLLLRLLDRGLMDPADAGSAEEALDFLLRTRHHMHLLRGSLHDTLEYSLQREVAAESGAPSAEVFMRGYYRHARVLSRLHNRAIAQLRDQLAPVPVAHHDGERRGLSFAVHADRLTIDPSRSSWAGAAEVLEAFLHLAESGVAPDPRLARMLEQSVPLFTDAARSAPEPARLFRRILDAEHAASALRAMNDLGVLGAFIPEFGELAALSQYSIYHYYTADEHTLIAVENAGRLKNQEGALGDLYRGLADRRPLLLAILLHDVGKARGIEGHEHTGAGMAAAVLRRLGMDEDLPTVEFLIRHHLLMEQTAFRRNVHDPSTVHDFTGRISSAEILDLLYLLTYADLSAVHAGVWTDWKASLLRDLHRQASAALRGTGPATDRARDGLVARLSRRHPRAEVEKHLAVVPGALYAALFTEDEIALHLTAVQRAEPVSVFIAGREAYAEVTIIARDAPFLLARCCAVLSANDANIFDAAVVTRDDGLVIDRFRVTGAASGRNPNPAAGAKIAADLREVLAGGLDVAHLFAAHRRRWRRRPRVTGSPGPDDVRFEDAGPFTIVDVYAADSLGLLYRLTDALSRLGLDIHFARIATRGDGVADAFYVRDRNGLPVTGAEDRRRIRTELLAVLAAAATEELA